MGLIDVMVEPLLRDSQTDMPYGYCIRCGGEIYEYTDDYICADCRAEADTEEEL